MIKKDPLTFVTTFIKEYQQIMNMMGKYLPILYQDLVLEHILYDGVRFVARNAKSLGNTVSPSALPMPSQHTCLRHMGCYKCGQSRCGLRKYLQQAKVFSSFVSPVFPNQSMD